MDAPAEPPGRPSTAWPTVLAGVVIFSFSAVLYKLSAAPPALGSTLRFAYATPPLLLIAWRARALRPGRALLPSAAAGVVVGIELVLWNEATLRIGAGPSTVIVNTASLWVMGLGLVLFGRRVERRSVVGVVVVLAGLGLLRGLGAHRLDLLGVLLAVVSAGLYGVYILLFDGAVSRAGHRITPVLWSSAVAVPVSALFVIALREDVGLSLAQHGWLALLGVGVQAGGWLVMAASLRWFTAVTISVLLLLQPALAALWGVALLGETLALVQVVGVVVVLGGVAVARPRAAR